MSVAAVLPAVPTRPPVTTAPPPGRGAMPPLSRPVDMVLLVAVTGAVVGLNTSAVSSAELGPSVPPGRRPPPVDSVAHIGFPRGAVRFGPELKLPVRGSQTSVVATA